jgi:hypothetical protein
MKVACGTLGAKCLAWLKAVGSFLKTSAHQLQAAASTTWVQVKLLRRVKYQLMAALAAGIAIGVGVYFAGPWLAAWTSGVGGFAAALKAQSRKAMERLYAVGSAD